MTPIRDREPVDEIVKMRRAALSVAIADTVVILTIAAVVIGAICFAWAGLP